MGGLIVIVGGIVFIGVVMDERFYVFDVEIGVLLWEY